MAEVLTPVEIFCSYAHEDETWLRKLETHLSLLKRQGLIFLWHDRLIAPGTDWASTIDAHLETASVILLLVSADFFASDYCYGIEMKRALERQKAGTAQVIPILVRSVSWIDAPFAHLSVLPANGAPLTTWQDADEALTDIVVDIRRALTGRLPRLVSHVPHLVLPTVWNIPAQRNPFFTGREDILDLLHAHFMQATTAALTQPSAVTGLGGIGKTQIAIEYAYRYREEYRYVLWVSVEKRETIMAGFVQLARDLDLLEQQNEVAAVVIRWLNTHNQWLLIMDNADDLDLAREFMPTAGQGHILLTSRDAASGDITSFEVDTLNEKTGMLFLLRRAKRLSFAETSVLKISKVDQDAACKIVQEMGGLALALDQAGAYIEETRGSFLDYLKAYQKRYSDLLEERGRWSGNHPIPTAGTWSLNFEQVQKRNSLAADLLNFCAYLAPDAIPEELIIAGARELGSQLQKLVEDETLLNDAISILRRFSLLQCDNKVVGQREDDKLSLPDNAENSFRTLSVHRLVQVVLRTSMADDSTRDWKRRVVLAVSAASPIVEDWSSFQIMKQREAFERWLPHALVCEDWIKEELMIEPAASYLLKQAGSYLNVSARYLEAEPLLVHAFKIRKQSLGADHQDTLQSINDIALLYLNQGKFAEAEPLLADVLKIREQQLRPDHLNTIRSLNDLAELYRVQGRYTEAELLLIRGIEIGKQEFRASQFNVVNSLSILGLLYWDLWKLAKAEALLVEALAIVEQQLIYDHPNIALHLNNLAMLYLNQEKYNKAEQFLDRAFIAQLELKDDYPGTAMILNNLAELYRVQGKYDEAELLSGSVLNIFEQLFGTDHPNIALCLNNLAGVYDSQEMYAEAESLYQRALSIRRQQLGANHPDTAQSLNNLAVLYLSQEKYDQAEQLFVDALAIVEQQFGIDHFYTTLSLNNLAMLYLNQNEYMKALELLIRAVKIVERELGTNHLYMTLGLNHIVILYLKQRMYDQAEPVLRRLLAIRTQQVGDNNQDTKMFFVKLAALYQNQEKYHETEPLSRHMFVLREQQWGALTHTWIRALTNWLCFIREFPFPEMFN